MHFGKIARLANALLGLWLFTSVFVWPHTTAQAANGVVVGLFISLTALAAWTTGPHLRLRLANAVLALWLLVSIGGFPRPWDW